MGGGYRAMSDQRASSWLSHHHTRSHHVVPPCPYPFPLKSNSTQPLPREGGSGARERKGKPNKSRARGDRPGWLSRGSQEQSVDRWDGVSRDQREGTEEHREGFIVFGEKEKENSPERTKKQK